MVAYILFSIAFILFFVAFMGWKFGMYIAERCLTATEYIRAGYVTVLLVMVFVTLGASAFQCAVFLIGIEATHGR
jgi:hypothetical protein